jgi:hypothetical protein
VAADGVAVSVAPVVDLRHVIRTRETFTDDDPGELVGVLRTPAPHWRPRR